MAETRASPHWSHILDCVQCLSSIICGERPVQLQTVGLPSAYVVEFFGFFFNNKKNFRAATAPLITRSRGSNG